MLEGYLWLECATFHKKSCSTSFIECFLYMFTDIGILKSVAGERNLMASTVWEKYEKYAKNEAYCVYVIDLFNCWHIEAAMNGIFICTIRHIKNFWICCVTLNIPQYIERYKFFYVFSSPRHHLLCWPLNIHKKKFFPFYYCCSIYFVSHVLTQQTNIQQ